MRDTSASRTIPPSLGKPARRRSGQSGAAFLPPNPNLDITRSRVVRKGCEVEFPATVKGCGEPGVRVKVARVRNGQFWPVCFQTPAFTPCCCVRVVSA